jgi:hypothetical protein
VTIKPHPTPTHTVRVQSLGMSAHCSVQSLGMSAHCSVQSLGMSAHCSVQSLGMSAHCSVQSLGMSAHCPRTVSNSPPLPRTGGLFSAGLNENNRQSLQVWTRSLTVLAHSYFLHCVISLFVECEQLTCRKKGFLISLRICSPMRV